MRSSRLSLDVDDVPRFCTDPHAICEGFNVSVNKDRRTL